MREKYQLEELDDATRDYLRNAKEHKAAGLPGVILLAADGSAMTCFVVGLMVVIGTVFATFPSTESETRTAMLQTAGFLMGGWMVACAFRIWSAQGRGRNLGAFWYADPNYLWAVTGSDVAVTPLGAIREARSAPEAGGTINIVVDTEAGAVSIPGQATAPGSLFIDFLNVLKVMRKDYPDAAQMSAAQLGNNALKTAQAGKFPDALDRSNGGLLDSLPHPQRANRASSGMLAMFLIVLFGVGGFYGLRALNVTLRDNAAFAKAQEAGTLGIREYLLDDRNQLHRPEAERLLSAAFEKSIAEILGKPDIVKPRAEAFCKLLRQVEAGRRNLMAVYVKEIPNPQVNAPGLEADKAAARENAIGERIQNKIIAALEPGLVGMYRTEDDAKSHVEFSWRYLPPEKSSGTRLQWTMTLRDGVAEKPLLSTTEIYKNPKEPNATGLLNGCIDEAFTKVFGMVLEIPVINLDEE